MKNTIIFLSVLLAIWIAGCTYYYMCKVRNHCNRNPILTESVQEQPGLVGSGIVTDTLAASTKDNPPPPPPPPLPPPPPPPPAYVILFNSGAGSCEMTSAHKDYFAAIKKFTESKPEGRTEIKIEVTGYADDNGPESMNMQLSERRAQFVKKQLVDAGIASERIVAMGKGENEPVSDNATPEGRSKNRRVEIQPN